MMTKNRVVKILVLFLLGALIAVDRVAWASVSQWQIDEAVNIWVGYTRGLLDMPVGLVSSQKIPNPNGMLIVGFFLSRLPDLWFVSTFLGCVQAGLIIWICWSNFKNSKKMFLVACVPLLVSVILRASSVEFWNQYFITFVNLFFLLWSIQYLSRPALWKIPFLTILVCFASALYLAGIVNSLAMLLVGVSLILYRSPENWKTKWWKPALISVAVIAFSAWITWYPYFCSVSFSTLRQLNHGGFPGLIQMVWAVVEAILGFPIYAPVQWAYVTFLNNSEELLSAPAFRLNDMTVWAGIAQGALALAAILFGLRMNWPRKNRFSSFYSSLNPDVARITVLTSAFIIISYALSPLLGGPKWALGERSDQVIQFLPFFLLFCFLTPFVFRFPDALARLFSRLTYTSVIIYAIVNIAAGFFIVQSHLDYRGALLTFQDMDVPLVQKMQAVDFIAADWKSISNSHTILVDYELGSDIWPWTDEFGLLVGKWYPGANILGRSFEYDLLRRYGLRNAQEGIQFRSFGTGRYLVTYAFAPAPHVTGVSLRHYIFGRLRVSVADK
jgi:hypothetical protein